MKKALVMTMVAATMVTGLFGINKEVEPKEDCNYILKTGIVTNIKYSENPNSKYWLECTDRMYVDVEGYTYEICDFIEDMCIDDDVLVCIDTKGTESQKDDVIKMWSYYVPDKSEPKEDCNKNEYTDVQNHLFDIMKGLKKIVKRRA